MRRFAFAVLPLIIAGPALAQSSVAAPRAAEAAPSTGRLAAHSHPVQPLRVPPPPRDRGDTSEAQRATAALNALAAQGYGAYSDFHAEGRSYVATISQNGTQHRVTVNPDTGQVTRSN